jgi:hypothetical protein
VKGVRKIEEIGRYVYCIIGSNEPLTVKEVAIEGGKDIYSVHYADLAAVVSESPLKKYSVTRDNTIAHQKVLEGVLAKHELLPMRFGTVVSKEDEIIQHLLKPRYKELKKLLKLVANKNQLGLKVFWPDMERVFQEIVDENPAIHKLKMKLMNMPVEQTRNQRIELGQMVEKALFDKKEAERARIIKPLQKIASDTRESDLFGDQMIANANFLVGKSRQEEFDAKVNELAETFGPNALFKYVGPIPPYDFVEINFTL